MERKMSLFTQAILKNARLVSLPDVYLRLREVLQDPDYSANDISRVISHDPAVTAKLLRIVNSAYFGLGTQIDSVSRAVGLLGSQGVSDLVLSMSVASSFNGISNEVMDMQRFWRKSVVRAITSRELAGRCNVLDSERLFVCGLLSDIGHLFLYQAVPQKAEQALQLARQRHMPLHKVERAMFSVDYAHIGAELVRHWQLPVSLSETIEFHVEPSKSTDYELFTSVVHIASLMTDADDQHIPLQEALARVSAYAWQATSLSVEDCEDIQPDIDSQVGGVMQLMFPMRQAA